MHMCNVIHMHIYIYIYAQLAQIRYRQTCRFAEICEDFHLCQYNYPTSIAEICGDYESTRMRWEQTITSWLVKFPHAPRCVSSAWPSKRKTRVSKRYGQFPKFNRVFWAETLAHWNPTSCQKTSTINLFGFQTQIENSKIGIMETDGITCFEAVFWLKQQHGKRDTC